MCYSIKHELFFVISTDFMLQVYNHNMIRLASLDMMKASQCHHVLFYDDQDVLITSGVQGCLVFQLQILTKHDPIVNLSLDPTGQNS